MEDTIENGNSLLDLSWATSSSGRPSVVYNQIYIHDIAFAGVSWKEKVENLMSKVSADYNADVFIVTALDEIAWLLNLRGLDIPYNPGNHQIYMKMKNLIDFLQYLKVI